MNSPEIVDLAEVAVGLLGVLADCGVAVFGGKVPTWRSIACFWLLTGGAAVPLWGEFEHFFNTQPGWAVLSSGLWFLFAFVTLAVTVAGVRGPVKLPPA